MNEQKNNAGPYLLVSALILAAAYLSTHGEGDAAGAIAALLIVLVLC